MNRVVSAGLAFSGSLRLFIQREVRQRQIGFRLHLGKPAGAAHKLVSEIPVGVDLFGQEKALMVTGADRAAREFFSK